MSGGNLLKHIVNLFSPKEQDISIDNLLEEVSDLLTRNQIGLVEIEREFDRTQKFEQAKSEIIKTGLRVKTLKNITLREILSLRKRLKSLSSCEKVFRQNIQIHESLINKLENIKAGGMKSITQDQFDEITIDYQIKLDDHNDVVHTAKAALDVEDFNYEDEDEELKALAKEIENEFDE